jgi:putative redox protein
MTIYLWCVIWAGDDMRLITVASCIRIGVALPIRRKLYNPPSPSILIAKEQTTLLTRCFATGCKEVIEEDNEMHRKHYSISGLGRRSKVTCKTNTNHTLEADVPKKMGGGDEAPQPVEHLLAALLGCTQATAVYVGRMMKPRLIIDKIDFKIEAYRDDRGALSLPITEFPPIPARLQRVTGSIVVHFKGGVEVSEEQLRILGQQTEARCPVANMMQASGCEMAVHWKNGADVM